MILELTIESLAAGGDGVARDADGRVTFVPRTAPGDRVRVELVDARKRFARGEVREVLEPSPDRVEPACRLFAECGGCQWLHVASAAQARAKQDILANALRRAVASGLELRPLVSPVPPLGWRRRARLHWVRRRRGRGVTLGFYQPGSRRVVDVDDCPQLEPALRQALKAVRERVAPVLLGSGELWLVVGASGEVHVVVSGACRGALGELVGIAGIAGVRAGRRSWGAADVELESGLRVPADRFAQASAAGNEQLCALVDEATAPRDGKRILELYAGTGNFTRTLVAGAAGVVAVDFVSGPPQERVSWRVGDVAEIVAAMAETEQAFDTAVLDPPRSGAVEALAGLAALRPQRIVYVSCDPATLARDIDRLCAAGYRPQWCQGVDVMPQTSHVEAVAVLTSEESTA